MTDLFQYAADMAKRFDGSTYDAKRDGARLSGVLERVHKLMGDGQWRTLAQISKTVGASEACVSARLRDLRKSRFGCHSVERRRVTKGLWEYRVAK